MQGTLERVRLREGKDLMAGADILGKGGSKRQERTQDSELGLLVPPLPVP